MDYTFIKKKKSLDVQLILIIIYTKEKTNNLMDSSSSRKISRPKEDRRQLDLSCLEVQCLNAVGVHKSKKYGEGNQDCSNGSHKV